MLAEVISPLTEFGVAGLMGALWVWERRLSRRRERQLDDAHERIVRHERHLDALMELVRSNTRAVEHFAQAQASLALHVEALHARRDSMRPSPDGARASQGE